ncbi:MAG: hypothetical protein JRN68_00570 [Nitrososphaerota archaeon]|jgi:hypothetical protein|nr:hypothetical protein [Nitrososphaerota archaeon]
MSVSTSNLTVVAQLGVTARSIVAAASGFIKFVLEQVVQLLLSIALPLSIAMLLLGITLYFTHLNRRMGRDFIVLSIVLALISQFFNIEQLIA